VPETSNGCKGIAFSMSHLSWLIGTRYRGREQGVTTIRLDLKRQLPGYVFFPPFADHRALHGKLPWRIAASSTASTILTVFIWSTGLTSGPE
jgi:hypothetical protein